MSVFDENEGALERLGVSPGLCGRCRFAELADSGRSLFLRCGRERQDRRFLRYPPLPVEICPGFEEVPRS